MAEYGKQKLVSSQENQTNTLYGRHETEKPQTVHKQFIQIQKSR